MFPLQGITSNHFVGTTVHFDQTDLSVVGNGRSVQRKWTLKGTVSRDFLLLVLFMRYSQLKVCHRCQRHRWQMEKSSIRKMLIILFGNLWVVEETNLSIFAFKFTFRCLQPDIVPIICHRWCTLTCEYLRKFSKKFEMILMLLSRAWGKVIHGKNLKQKISWHCPFKARNWKTGPLPSSRH